MTEKNHRQTAMYFFVGFLGCIISSNVKADEEMIPIAMAGDWVAMAHHTSSISAPDMCVAVRARLRMRYGESEAPLCAARRGFASTEAERPLGREHRSAAKPRRMTAVVAFSNGL